MSGRRLEHRRTAGGGGAGRLMFICLLDPSGAALGRRDVRSASVADWKTAAGGGYRAYAHRLGAPPPPCIPYRHVGVSEVSSTRFCLAKKNGVIDPGSMSF